MLKDIGIQTAMKLTQLFRVVSATAAVFVCGVIAHAQDVNSSWLLRAPQLTSMQSLNLSAARIDFTQSQPAQTPNPNDSASSIPPTDRNSAIHDEPAEHRFWDATND